MKTFKEWLKLKEMTSTASVASFSNRLFGGEPIRRNKKKKKSKTS